MFDPNSIFDRLSRVRGLCAGTLAWALAALPLVACTLVLGDIPPKPTHDKDAGNDPVHGFDSGGSSSPATGGAGAGAGTAAGGAIGWDADRTDASPDAREASNDAQLPDANSENTDGTTEGREAGNASDAACSAVSLWYVDEDADGYGRDEGPVSGCAPADGNYALQAGDCNDQDERAHPGQTRYFGTAHTPPGGVASFDFDCSGIEQGDPTQTRLESCGLLALALCDGTGYAPGPRVGFGIDRFCGSTTLVTCAPSLGILVCDESSVTIADNPYRCR